MIELDARGLDCPAPVLMTKDAIEKEHPDRVVVIVDNEPASENVSRFMTSQGYAADVVPDGDLFRVTGKGNGAATEQPAEETRPDPEQQKVMVMVTTDRMGSGDDELGLKLMINFLKTVGEMGDDLWRLVFVNAGVKMAIEGSKSLEALQTLEKEGLQILVCGTCLDHFQLLEQKQVGQTTNMLDIVMAMQFADKVVSL